MQSTIIVARCWVCDGLPLAMGLCLVCHGKNSRCRVCRGIQVMNGLCPACRGARVCSVPRRHDVAWRDPLICPLCQGDNERRQKCDLCHQHSGRLFIHHQEAEYLDSLHRCPCVAASLRYDPIIGAVATCPVCEGFGVISLARQIYIDIHMTRQFVITPPRDLYYAALVRAWHEIAPAAPPQWPWQRTPVHSGGAA